MLVMAKAKVENKSGAKDPEVTACTASAVGADGRPPLDRPEWLIGTASATAIKDTLKALCAPHKVPKSNFIDVTVNGVEVRLIALPPYKSGAYEERTTLIEAWKRDRQPLHAAHRDKIVGGIFIVPVPNNLSRIPTDDVNLLGGWLRSISKSLPLYINPRGYVTIYTAKTAWPDGMRRGRTYWTTYDGIRLLLSTGNGKTEVWQQILEVARAP